MKMNGMVSLILGGICMLRVEVWWVKSGKGVGLNHKINILNSPPNQDPSTKEEGIRSIEAEN